MGSILTTNQEQESFLKLAPDAIADDLQLIGRIHDEKVFSGFINSLSNKNKLNIPLDIYKLCLSFYDTNSLQWKVNITENIGKRVYNEMQISLLNTDIKAYIKFKLTIHAQNYCVFNRKISIISPTYGTNIRIYIDINCNELNYERKYIKPYNKTAITKTFRLDVISGDVLTFNFYFKILPSYRLRAIVPTLRSHPVTMSNGFKWEFNAILMNAILNSCQQQFYSDNFYNEGYYCLSVCNQTWRDNDIYNNRNELVFTLKCISNPFDYDTSILLGNLTIFTCYGSVYQQKVKNKSTVFKLGRDILIKSVEFNFVS